MAMNEQLLGSCSPVTGEQGRDEAEAPSLWFCTHVRLCAALPPSMVVLGAAAASPWSRPCQFAPLPVKFSEQRTEGGNRRPYQLVLKPIYPGFDDWKGL